MHGLLGAEAERIVQADGGTGGGHHIVHHAPDARVESLGGLLHAQRQIDLFPLGHGHDGVVPLGHRDVFLLGLHRVLVVRFDDDGVIDGAGDDRLGIVERFRVGVAVFAVLQHPHADTEITAADVLIHLSVQNIYRKAIAVYGVGLSGIAALPQGRRKGLFPKFL